MPQFGVVGHGQPGGVLRRRRKLQSVEFSRLYVASRPECWAYLGDGVCKIKEVEPIICTKGGVCAWSFQRTQGLQPQPSYY